MIRSVESLETLAVNDKSFTLHMVVACSSSIIQLRVGGRCADTRFLSTTKMLILGMLDSLLNFRTQEAQVSRAVGNTSSLVGSLSHAAGLTKHALEYCSLCGGEPVQHSQQVKIISYRKYYFAHSQGFLCEVCYTLATRSRKYKLFLDHCCLYISARLSISFQL